jgi:hypothetical protein
MSRLLPLLLLAACVTHSPDVQPFGFCASSDAVDPSVLSSGDVAVTVDGPVVASGTEVPDDCVRGIERETTSEVADVAAWWLRAAGDDGATWTIGVWLRGTAAPENGDVVHADLAYRFGDFSPTVASLELRDADDALLAWMGFGGDLPDLHPPEGVTLAQGRVASRHASECGRWASYDVDVTTPEGAAVLQVGDTLQIDGLELRHGGFDEATGSRSRCQDWFVADVAVAIVPVP